MWSRWLTYKHIKQYLDVSVPTLHKWIKELGFPRPFEIGINKLYFDRREVDEWMAKNKNIGKKCA